MEGPQKIVKIALDDYIRALRGMVSATLIGQIEDELKTQIPNMLKDEKKRVRYSASDPRNHIFLYDPEHEIVVTHIKHDTI